MRSGKHAAYTAIRWTFFVLSLLYLAWFAHNAISAQESQIGRLMAASALETALAACMFATTVLPSVVGWRALLARLSHPVPFNAAFRVFSLTQVAKYLPGNIGHHVGRVVLAKTQLDIPAFSTATSIFQEAGLVALAALSVGTLCYVAHPFALPLSLTTDVDARVLLLGVLGGGLLALVLVNAMRGQFGLAANPLLAWIFRVSPSWRAVGGALPPYILIYIVNGLAVACIAGALMPVRLVDLLLLTGAYALSWMVGFLLPGAPGGLGVRESAFIALLSGAYPADAVFAVSVLSRVATVIADLLILLAGLAAARSDIASRPIN